MAFSETVGTTRVNVGQLMADAAALCGKLPSDLTGERIDIAKRQLFYFLMASANLGINLWTITQDVIGIIPLKEVYDLPIGTVDILNLQYRQFSRPTGDYASSAGGTAANAFDNDLSTTCAQTSANGNISVNFGSSIPITCLGFMPASTATLNLVYEYSLDGSTWTQIYAPGSMVYTDSEWSCAQITAPVSAQYFRVRETGGGTLNVREAVFGYNIYDIACSRISRDEYAVLPSKDQQANMPPIYWYNRVLTQPQIYVWPPAQNCFQYQLVVYRTRQVMDVGDLTNELEVPDRWLDATVVNLAERMSIGVFNDVPRDRRDELKQRAAYFLQLAGNEERDLSPITLGFNNACYTR